MSFFAWSFRLAAGRGDRKRDKDLVKPEMYRHYITFLMV